MSGFWKALAGVLIAVIVTGAGAWMTFGGDKVNRADLKEAIDAIASRTDRDAGELRMQVKELVKSQHELAIETSKLTQRLSDFITHREK